MFFFSLLGFLLLTLVCFAKSKSNEQLSRVVLNCFEVALSGGLEQLRRNIQTTTTGTTGTTTTMETTTGTMETTTGTTTTTIGDADEEPPKEIVNVELPPTPADGIPPYLKNVQLTFRNKFRGTVSLELCYKEFYGLENNLGGSISIEGGFYGLEKKYKAKWRRGYSAADAVFFSAVKRCFQGLHNKAGIAMDGGGDWNAVAAVVTVADRNYLAAKGFEQFARKLRDDGYLEKKTRAKRKRAETSAVEQATAGKGG